MLRLTDKLAETGVSIQLSCWYQAPVYSALARAARLQCAAGGTDTIFALRQAGQIVDDELCMLLVNPLPQGVRMHAIIDACHSGSVLDL